MALVAQMVERKTLNLVVVGSSPTEGAFFLIRFIALTTFWTETKNSKFNYEMKLPLPQQLSWRSWQRVGLIIPRSPVRSRSKAYVLPDSLGGQDTRLSPERPGFNSRSGNFFFVLLNWITYTLIWQNGLQFQFQRPKGIRWHYIKLTGLRIPNCDHILQNFQMYFQCNFILKTHST